MFMFPPYSTYTILFLLPTGAIHRWRVGEAGWLRALTEEEVSAATRRLAEARTERLLTQHIEASVRGSIWTAGPQPVGTPIGVEGLSLRLPTCADYGSSGWISPQGQFFPCGSGEHERLADALAQHGSPELEEAGWVRVARWMEVCTPSTPEQRSWLRNPGPTPFTG